VVGAVVAAVAVMTNAVIAAPAVVAHDVMVPAAVVAHDVIVPAAVVTDPVFVTNVARRIVAAVCLGGHGRGDRGHCRE
jgi:hypothetical protein